MLNCKLVIDLFDGWVCGLYYRLFMCTLLSALLFVWFETLSWEFSLAFRLYMVRELSLAI